MMASTVKNGIDRLRKGNERRAQADTRSLKNFKQPPSFHTLLRTVTLTRRIMKVTEKGQVEMQLRPLTSFVIATVPGGGGGHTKRSSLCKTDTHKIRAGYEGKYSEIGVSDNQYSALTLISINTC